MSSFVVNESQFELLASLKDGRLQQKPDSHCINHLKKVKSLCLTWHHTMKACMGVVVELHAFLSKATERGMQSDSRSGHLTPPARSPSDHRIRGLVGFRTDLDTVEKRIICSSCG